VFDPGLVALLFILLAAMHRAAKQLGVFCPILTICTDGGDYCSLLQMLVRQLAIADAKCLEGGVCYY